MRMRTNGWWFGAVEDTIEMRAVQAHICCSRDVS